MTDFFNTLILLGAIQGFIFSALLFFNKINLKSNRLLSALLFFISLASLDIYLLESGMTHWSAEWLVFAAVAPMIVVMPVGPLIYFYIRNASGQPVINSAKHFIPVGVDLFPYLFAAINIIGTETFTVDINANWVGVVDTWNIYSDVLRWISITGYLMLSLRFLKKAIVNKTTDFLRQFVYIFLVFQSIWLLHLIPYILPQFRDALMNTVGWYPIYIPLAALIYWLGLKGYLSSGTLKNKTLSQNSFSPEVVASTIEVLRRCMETDKLFLDPLLNLNRVIDHLQIPQKVISHVLNQHLHKSFNEFVNDYRLAEFRTRIDDPSYSHMTIAGVALECGFNSQATFQRFFKQSMGISPTDYLSRKSQIKIPA
jgi:AraC-like DNA-binding protein